MGLKQKKHLKWIAVLSVFYLMGFSIYFICSGQVWSSYDYKVLDIFYKNAVRYGWGPKSSFNPQIVYLTITDESYDAFGKNYLDRKDMARVNMALAELGSEVVVYDIIFARKSSESADTAFAQSLEALGSAYLPFALPLSENSIKPEKNTVQLNKGFPGHLFYQTGMAEPYYGTRAVLQYPAFFYAAAGVGNISVLADHDSVYRHIPLLVKIRDSFYPSLSFSVFLDWARVSFKSIQVEWGTHILIPATEDNLLEKDLSIPIDKKGRVYIPFVNSMGKDFRQMSAHVLVEAFSDENLRGNLFDFFEGNFVMIADVAMGTSDLGDTPLEKDVPLVILHASLLNSLLTHTFYRPWPFGRFLTVTALLSLLLVTAASMKNTWFLYGTGVCMAIGVTVFTGVQFAGFYLFPVVTAGGVLGLVFIGLVMTLEVATAKDRTLIKNTFARYVPPKVMAELLNNPDLVTLGGEEQEVTVLFSDIEGFTSVSEDLPPKILVELLNEYFTEMTDIVLENGGIIDKYIGDAIMAEFGVPIPRPGHADQAIATALGMQHRLISLRKKWKAAGLPELHCRVGINTSKMIVGNIGSTSVFDYTVIGDAVNLASRLEGENKKYGTSIIISQGTFAQMTPGLFNTRSLGIVVVRGKTHAVRIYEVCGPASTDLTDKRPGRKG